MNDKRKHRVVVEVTFSKPVSDHDAVWLLKAGLERIDTQAAPVRYVAQGVYINKLDAKSFARVMAAEARK